jgi:hypothetical protein
MSFLSSIPGASGYNTGGVASSGGQYGLGPFDPMILQAKYIDGGETPNRVISIESIGIENKIGPVEKCVYLYDITSVFETPVLGIKAQNLHRNGASRASPVWCVVPKSVLSVGVFSKLFTKALPDIKVMTLAYIKDGTPAITETVEFNNCFVVFANPFGNGYFTSFAFTFTKVNWSLDDYDQCLESSEHTRIGTYACSADYTTGISVQPEKK